MKVVPMKKIYLDVADMTSVIGQYFRNQYPEATDIQAEVKMNDDSSEYDGYKTNVYAVVTITME